MRRFRAVPQRLERNLHLDRPAAVETPGAHVPHRIPVDVRNALVYVLRVGPRAERVRVEVEAVAAIVERVEQHREGIVLAELARVAPHLVRHPLALGRRIPHARRHIHVVFVEEDPRLGPFGGRRARVGHQLNEARDRRNRPVHCFIEHAVEVDGAVEPCRADRHPALLVAVHHRRWNRSAWTIDQVGTDCAGDLLLTGRGTRAAGQAENCTAQDDTASHKHMEASHGKSLGDHGWAHGKKRFS